MREPIHVLKGIQQKAIDKTYRFQRLYRNLYNPEFYLLAYQNIAKSQGSMTAGADGITLDGMSMARIEAIITSIKDRSYQPKPARRTYITKKNGKKRPLGIPSANDRLVEEVVRMLLEAIYEPAFSKYSHGFRPRRSCHTALKEIQLTFSGTKWMIEGDIQGCFDNFDHHVLIDLLRKRIADEAFLSLMWKFLKAGYMEQWTYHTTHSGTPQGSGMSPILANIYMSELDQFIARKMLEFQRKESYRKPSKEYEKIHRKYLYWMKRYKELRELGRLDESEQALQTMKSCRKIMFQTNGHDPFDPKFKSIQYNRYADDFLVGVIGSKQEAVSLKEQIADFLKDTLKLTLSMEKTKVTHSSQRVRYLGYDIFVSRSKDTKRSKNGTLRRAWYGTVNLRMPHEKWQSKLQEYKAFIITHGQHGKEQWRAMPRRPLVNREDIDILRKFNSEISGLYQYYRLALNVSTLNKFLYIMEYSMLKTFGMKYRAKVSKIKEKYVRNGHFGVDYMTKAGPKRCEFYHDGFQMNEQAAPVYADILPEYRKRQWSNSLANRLKAGTCEICGLKTDSILIHHVKKLKKLKGKNIYELKMLEIRRKTLALCQNCYLDCHNVDAHR